MTYGSYHRLCSHLRAQPRLAGTQKSLRRMGIIRGRGSMTLWWDSQFLGDRDLTRKGKMTRWILMVFSEVQMFSGVYRKQVPRPMFKVTSSCVWLVMNAPQQGGRAASSSLVILQPGLMFGNGAAKFMLALCQFLWYVWTVIVSNVRAKKGQILKGFFFHNSSMINCSIHVRYGLQWRVHHHLT